MSVDPRRHRHRVSVAHEKLPTQADLEQWKPFWKEWLEALDDPG